GEIGGVGGDFVSDDAVLDVFLVRQSEVFLRSDVTEHGGAEPTDHRSADGAGDVIVARGDVGGQRPERVERSFAAPIQLLFHVLFDHVHGDVAGPFVHDLAAHFPGNLRQFSLGAQFGKLGFIIGIGDRTGPQTVAQAEADVVGA